MEYHVVSGTELSVSRVCLGTMTFGSQVDGPTAASMVDLCLERGVNFFDTANAYNGGESEVILGQCLAGRRDRAIVATKLGNKVGEDSDQVGLSAAAVRRQVDESLRRLKTDYLDIYYLHQPDYNTPLDETLGAIDEQIQAGKIRCLGASNFASWQVCRMLWSADQLGYEPVRVMQPMYNLLARGIEQEFLPMCAEFGLTNVVYNPLAGGLLTGKHRAGSPPGEGTRFDRLEPYRQRYWHTSNFDVLDELSSAARIEERSLISLALGWLLHHTRTDVVILGASGLDQLEENLQCAEHGPLSDTVVATCDSVWDRLRGPTPRYNR